MLTVQDLQNLRSVPQLSSKLPGALILKVFLLQRLLYLKKQRRSGHLQDPRGWFYQADSEALQQLQDFGISIPDMKNSTPDIRTAILRHGQKIQTALHREQKTSVQSANSVLSCWLPVRPFQ